MKTITLSKDNICGYSFKQEGYGRQGLYLDIFGIEGCKDQKIYWGSVFPNIREHWRLYTWDEVHNKLSDEPCEWDEHGVPTEFKVWENKFVDYNGRDVELDHIFDSLFDGIVAMVSGDEREVEEIES